MFKLNTNLLLILILNQKDYNILFFKNEIEIQSNNIVIVIEIIKSKIYLFCVIDKAFFNIEKPENINLVKMIFILFTKLINYKNNLMF